MSGHMLSLVCTSAEINNLILYSFAIKLHQCKQMISSTHTHPDLVTAINALLHC